MLSSFDLATAVVSRLDDGVWALAIDDGRVLDTNEAACDRLDQHRGALTGSFFGDVLVPPMSADGWQLLVGQVPDDGEHRLTVSLRRSGDGIVPAELVLIRHRDVIVALTRDIDDRVRLVESLRMQRELLDSTIDALGEGVAVVDRFGRIETANATFSRFVDVPVDQLVDRSVFDPPWTCFDEDGVAMPAEATAPVLALRSGGPARTEICQVRGNGRTREAGVPVWMRVSCEPLRDASGGTDGAVVTLADLTATRQAQVRLLELERTDALTGLSSRSHITAALDAAVEAADRSEGERIGVLHIDIDGFRSINDTFGTSLGDEVLATIGGRLADLVDRHVEIGRLGVDEFLIVVTGSGAGLEFDSRLRRLAEEVQRRTERPLEIDGMDLRTTASVGVSRWPGDGDDARSLLRAADRALVAGRADGRHQLRFYERSLDERTRTGLALDHDLRRAAAQRGLEVHYQPIIDLRTGAVAAAEALVRWHHPSLGPIPPSVFIPTAEATGAISAVSDLVMTTVAEDLATWNNTSLLPQDARIAVNISAAEFEQRGFVERLNATLAAAGVEPAQLELEITETLLMNDLETTAARLSKLDELGFLVALDDFGTGYSSLSYLHSLPLHTLKVDRCFVGDLRDGRSETITRAILSLAHGLGIVAVGEGVETEEQRQFLLDAGCDLVQGYYYAPPLPRPAFEQFLRDHADAAASTAEPTGDLQPH